MKPRVMFLVVFTALVGMVAAPGSMHPVLAIAALICIAAGAGAVRRAQYVVRRRYRRGDGPHRRASDPARAGDAERGAVIRHRAGAAARCVCLGLMANWVAAALLALTIGFYVFVYTMWLKRTTPQNIVIGGAAGAVPPMIGWAAATGSIGLEPFVLFLIIFIWTPPHFWALAILRTRDYERAGVPMMPVVHGADATRLQILIYSLILAPLGMVPAIIGLGGTLYAIAASVLGSLFVVLALACYREREGEKAATAPPRTCSPIRCFICFCCSPFCSSSKASVLRRRACRLSGRRDARCGTGTPTPPTQAIHRHRVDLFGLVVLFFIVTIVRLGGHVADPAAI